MKAKDHIGMGTMLADAYGLRGGKRLAFLAGSILPDLNLFSYLTLSRENMLRGHSYTFKRRKMERHLRRPRKDSVFWWLRTGVFCHYLADSFTGSHDEKRRMTIAGHREYEKQLHRCFHDTRKTLRIRPVGRTVPAAETIVRMRREYETSKQGVETDCRMILEAVKQVMADMAGE
ncbi:MAG: zinc dependent phospholipase C family protein [Clostridia bacterium]|nr:zinc dependent phospholipase C family protein [Clostridia bacterium]